MKKLLIIISLCFTGNLLADAPPRMYAICTQGHVRMFVEIGDSVFQQDVFNVACGERV